MLTIQKGFWIHNFFIEAISPICVLGQVECSFDSTVDEKNPGSSLKKSKDWCFSRKRPLSRTVPLNTWNAVSTALYEKFSEIQIVHRIDAFPNIFSHICSSEHVERSIENTALKISDKDHNISTKTENSLLDFLYKKCEAKFRSGSRFPECNFENFAKKHPFLSSASCSWATDIFTQKV